jgi:hypothetical protein
MHGTSGRALTPPTTLLPLPVGHSWLVGRRGKGAPMARSMLFTFFACIALSLLPPAHPPAAREQSLMSAAGGECTIKTMSARVPRRARAGYCAWRWAALFRPFCRRDGSGARDQRPTGRGSRMHACTECARRHCLQQPNPCRSSPTLPVPHASQCLCSSPHCSRPRAPRGSEEKIDVRQGAAQGQWPGCAVPLPPAASSSPANAAAAPSPLATARATADAVQRPPPLDGLTPREPRRRRAGCHLSPPARIYRAHDHDARAA